jgi:hypothetical protein
LADLSELSAEKERQMLNDKELKPIRAKLAEVEKALGPYEALLKQKRALEWALGLLQGEEPPGLEHRALPPAPVRAPFGPDDFEFAQENEEGQQLGLLATNPVEVSKARRAMAKGAKGKSGGAGRKGVFHPESAAAAAIGVIREHPGLRPSEITERVMKKKRDFSARTLVGELSRIYLQGYVKKDGKGPEARYFPGKPAIILESDKPAAPAKKATAKAAGRKGMPPAPGERTMLDMISDFLEEHPKSGIEPIRQYVLTHRPQSTPGAVDTSISVALREGVIAKHGERPDTTYTLVKRKVSNTWKLWEKWRPVLLWLSEHPHSPASAIAENTPLKDQELQHMLQSSAGRGWVVREGKEKPHTYSITSACPTLLTG